MYFTTGTGLRNTGYGTGNDTGNGNDVVILELLVPVGRLRPVFLDGEGGGGVASEGWRVGGLEDWSVEECG